MENVQCPFFCSNPLYYLYKEQGFARPLPAFFFGLSVLQSHCHCLILLKSLCT